MNDLTLPEKSELRALEGVIESGMKTFVDVGLALVKIRDGRLYREKFKTFEGYCQERWGMTKRFANYQIAAAEVTVAMGTTVPKPETERVARPLTRLPAEKQSEAWTAANAKADGEGRKVTARDVEEVVVEMVETKPKEAEKKRAFSVGYIHATNAIKELESIPARDRERNAALDMVENWIKENR